jgi:hypothetical protein
MTWSQRPFVNTGLSILDIGAVAGPSEDLRRAPCCQYASPALRVDCFMQ